MQSNLNIEQPMAQARNLSLDLPEENLFKNIFLVFLDIFRVKEKKQKIFYFKMIKDTNFGF